MKYVDYFLDRITMYRLVLYYLIGLLLAAVGLSIFGSLGYKPASIAFSAVYITLVCWISNRLFAYVFKAPVNVESVYITALILALIVTPIRTSHDLIFLTAIGGLAIASKFILAIKNKHIFNPAAVAVALTAAGAGQSASWWVGSLSILPFVVIGGLLVVRKIKRFTMVLSFFGAVIMSTVLVNIALSSHSDALFILQKTAFHSSLFFLAFIMLTEPLTSPATKGKQIWYGILAGTLFPPQIHIFNTYSTPELTLLVANVYAYLVSPKYKLMPTFIKKVNIAHNSLDFIFRPDRRVSYKPGQYMEWTLTHNNSDSRGNRRYFTLASSPTEEDLRLGVKFYPGGSSFKKAMLAMDESTPIAAGQLGGDFTLPDDQTKKLAFIAGGIGITPVRSMVKYMLDTNQNRSATLLYSGSTGKDFAYIDVFSEAERRKILKATYTITESAPQGWHGQTGYINKQMIINQIPDYMDRLFYISGSHSLVTAVSDALHSIGVSRHQIKIDFFPGYM
ncbi:RnfABCDGE type electron transport complex subunit D [Candidatus Saccharibacteria bacterium]|nr:RnfABCDGE type electron transport complex subunit D [Candidatus Saccharibacteria bacterium]